MNKSPSEQIESAAENIWKEFMGLAKHEDLYEILCGFWLGARKRLFFKASRSTFLTRLLCSRSVDYLVNIFFCLANLLAAKKPIINCSLMQAWSNEITKFCESIH